MQKSEGCLTSDNGPLFDLWGFKTTNLCAHTEELTAT